MTKELHVAIMKSSRLRNKFLSEKHQANRDNYKSQCNICKKTKTHILSILIQNYSQIIELFVKQIFLSLQQTVKKRKCYY